MTDIILKAEHLKKVFVSGKKYMTAADDVSFELNRGECLGVVGESGSGKSTIAKMITHLEPVTEGQVFLKGKDITHVKGKAFREIYQDIQMVFQMPMESFDPRCTLGDGIGESLRNMGISRSETGSRVEKLLERCGLDREFADRYPHQVSGGQCQRAAIARALAVNPETVSYTHLRAHETGRNLVCRLLLEKKKIYTSPSQLDRQKSHITTKA